MPASRGAPVSRAPAGACLLGLALLAGYVAPWGGEPASGAPAWQPRPPRVAVELEGVPGGPLVVERAEEMMLGELLAEAQLPSRGLGAEELARRVGDAAQVELGPAGRVTLRAMSPETRLLLGRPLDLNRASAEELELLPGIGPALARRIVQAREARQGFATPDDLLAVPGIKGKKFERLRPFVIVGPQIAPGPSPSAGARDEVER